MPVITIEAGAMEKEQKNNLIKNFTREASAILDIPQDAFIVVIKENNPDNIGTGGKMLSKVFEERS